MSQLQSNDCPRYKYKIKSQYEYTLMYVSISIIFDHLKSAQCLTLTLCDSILNFLSSSHYFMLIITILAFVLNLVKI